MTDLFSLPPEVEADDMRVERMARKTDPQTSKDAARRAAVRIQMSHQNAILGILYRPMIPPEIGALIGLSVVQVDRRRKELLERGEIRLTGVERDGYQEWERVCG